MLLPYFVTPVRIDLGNLDKITSADSDLVVTDWPVVHKDLDGWADRYDAGERLQIGLVVIETKIKT